MFLLRLIIASLIAGVDQISKALVICAYAGRGPVPVFPYINYSYARNNGAAFGFLAQHSGWQRWFFVTLALVVSTVLVVWLKRLRTKERWLGLGLTMILGGALGNLSDRIFRGQVIDFIDFHIGNWHWYTFNIADIAICVGAAIVLICSFLDKQSQSH